MCHIVQIFQVIIDLVMKMRSQKLVSQIGYEWCSTTSGQEINIIKRHKQYDSRNANKSTAPQIDTAFIYFRNFNTVITANVFFIPLHFTKTMEPGCKQYL